MKIKGMKIISYLENNNVRLGVVNNEQVININEIFTDMLSIINQGNDGVEAIKEYISKNNNETLDIHKVQLLPPIPELKRNIICIGWNYLKHFEERYQQDIELPTKPTVFTKATGAVAGPYENIPSMKNFTNKLDYEAELAVVIGKEGSNIDVDTAENYIFGYMAANDLSARDVQQQHGGQWFMGKSMDKSCPMGPWIVTRDEIDDVQNLSISCKVNGEIVQSSNTSLMIFSINEIISTLSKAMTLKPGDIILTGTPSGVGFRRNPPLFLKDGDVVEVNIEQVGTIKNKIVDL